MEESGGLEPSNTYDLTKCYNLSKIAPRPVGHSPYIENFYYLLIARQYHTMFP